MSDRVVASSDPAAVLDAPRFRTPRPLPTGARVAVAVAVVVVLVAGASVLRSATREDADGYPSQGWIDRPQPPRAALVDEFPGTGELRAPKEFGAWQVADGTLVADDGVLRSTGGGGGMALVDPGAEDVVVFARVVTTGPGDGLAIADDAAGRLTLVRADAGDRWTLERDGTAIGGFDGPGAEVTVEVIRQGAVMTVTIDGESQEVRLAEPIPHGPVGVVAAGSALVVDLFAYLPLTSDL